MIITCIFLIGLNLRRKTQQEIKDYLSTIENLTAQDTISQGKISMLNAQVREMLRQQFEASDYVYTRYYEQIDDNKKAEDRSLPRRFAMQDRISPARLPCARSSWPGGSTCCRTDGR